MSGKGRRVMFKVSTSLWEQMAGLLAPALMNGQTVPLSLKYTEMAVKSVPLLPASGRVGVFDFSEWLSNTPGSHQTETNRRHSKSTV